MSFNLSRNTRVFFTTNLDAVGNINANATTAFSSANVAEIQVLDGFSFSQGTQQQAITISEGGNTPNRGSRSFNTQLDPVEWSFSTYFRPDSSNGAAAVTTSERWLWNAIFGADAIDTAPNTATTITRAATTGAAAATATVIVNTTDVTSKYPVGSELNISGATNSNQWNVAGRVLTSVFSTNTTLTVELAKAPNIAAGTAALGSLRVTTGQYVASPLVGTAAGSFAYASTVNSNVNQLQRFGLVFSVDSVLYAIDNCAVDQASIDFGLDSIAMVAWSGKGTRLREISTEFTLANLATGAANVPSATARYITNKLSTALISSGIGGIDGTANVTGSVAYTVAITGGNITIANNLTYLTPSNLGVVNSSIGYFTGTRAISGNMTAYLRTGTAAGNGTGKLLSDIITANAAETKFGMNLQLGGGTNAVRVEFDMPGVMLQVPTVDVQDVVSTQITFAAQPFDPATVGAASATATNFDLTRTNELQVRFFAN